MNKNLVEIWKNCSYRPTNWDHLIIIFLSLAMYQSYIINNFMFMFTFGLMFLFKMISYITYLVNSASVIDELECKRALRIYELLEDGNKNRDK